MSHRRPRVPLPSPVETPVEGLPPGLRLYLITGLEQARGPWWQKVMQMPYLSTYIMRGYLRTFKQGFRIGAVAFIVEQDRVVAMGLRVTSKPAFAKGTRDVVAFYVRPAWRRKGLGKLLYGELEKAVPPMPGPPWIYSHDKVSSGFYTAIGVQKPTDEFDTGPAL